MGLPVGIGIIICHFAIFNVEKKTSKLRFLNCPLQRFMTLENLFLVHPIWFVFSQKLRINVCQTSCEFQRNNHVFQDKKSDRDHERRRKRKSPQSHTEVEQPPEKLLKEEENNNSDDERKVSSTEDANPLPKNEVS